MHEVIVDRAPSNTEEFLALRDQIATTPEGGAAMFVLAMLKYSHDPQMGRHWAIIATDPQQLTRSSLARAYREFDLNHSANFALEQLNSKPYISASYVAHSSPESGYALAPGPLKIRFERAVHEGQGVVKVYVVSSGADTARPITLKQNSAGFWKGFEYSSLFVGVRAPAAARGAIAGDF